jgi:microcystin-dependent protein
MRNSTNYYSFLITLLAALLTNLVSAQVGFNNPNPAPSSILDLTANDKGLLIPRMTTAQRSAIVNPANGLLVFDISLKAFCYYDTVSNPDKWMLLGAVKADASLTGHSILVSTGNLGLGVPVPKHKLDVAGNIKSTDTIIGREGNFTGQVTATSFSGSGSVPSGAIIMWYGATLPTGWVICDGANGTPDLRGRFVLGAGTNANPSAGDINPTYTVGATGGENKHTLTKAELPKHKHTVTNTLSDNGQVTIGTTATNDTYMALLTGYPGIPDLSGAFSNIAHQPTHTHAISGTTGDGTTDGLNSQAQENRPPYYVLTFIMKQ